MSGRRPGCPKGSIRDPRCSEQQHSNHRSIRFQNGPFFTQTDLKSQDEGDEAPDGEKTDPGKVWFAQPKYMPDWLYRHFRPMVTQKEKGSLVKPAVFTNTPPFFWINHPEPIFALSDHHLRTFPPTTIQIIFLVSFWREVAADFQNRSINPGPKCDTMQCCQYPQWLTQSATNHRASGFKSVRLCIHADVVSASTVQVGRNIQLSSHLYSTIQTLRELHGVSGSRQGEKCTWDKDKLKKSAWEVLE
ncbi:hypothetical protein B0H14DRAFT_3136780 [Mycena olivaceomarginata]|nr:hypothetical protein B0H14DRAFT_3136780 [Mycena olivaceomarginata]